MLPSEKIPSKEPEVEPAVLGRTMGRVDVLRRRFAARLIAGQDLQLVAKGKAPDALHPAVWERVRRETMTDSARVDAVYEAATQIVDRGIPGDLVECGVYRGGCSMAMALGLRAAGSTDRTIWLYDTFAGMTRPTELDVRLHDGQDALPKFEERATGQNSADWCAADVETVRANMRSTGYPENHLRFVVGPVEKTLLTDVPDCIALLRLDTDWYESTKVELEVLLPRLSPGGVLIVDDYNHWSGSRRAVDEYFSASERRPVMFPVGKSSVMATIG
jgi:predicted O-methyltransferase YrrM